MNLGVFLADGDISKKFAIFAPKENTFFPQTKNSPFLTQIAVHVHGGIYVEELFQISGSESSSELAFPYSAT